MTTVETRRGTDAAGLRFVAYASPGRWSAVAQEVGGGWWRIWLVPGEKGQPPRPLWDLCQWSEGYACGVAEHIARAFAVVQQAVEPGVEEEKQGG